MLEWNGVDSPEEEKEELESIPASKRGYGGGLSGEHPTTPSLATIRAVLKTPALVGLASVPRENTNRFPEVVLPVRQAHGDPSPQLQQEEEEEADQEVQEELEVVETVEVDEDQSEVQAIGNTRVSDPKIKQDLQDEPEQHPQVEQEEHEEEAAAVKPVKVSRSVKAPTASKSKSAPAQLRRTPATSATELSSPDKMPAPSKRGGSARTTRRDTTEEPEVAPVPPSTRGSKSSRNTRRNTTEEPEDPAAATEKPKLTRGSRAAKATPVIPETEEEAPQADRKPATKGKKPVIELPMSKTSRGKTALVESTDQPASLTSATVDPEPTSKPTRGRKPTAAKKAVEETKEKSSVSSRAKKGKENVKQEEETVEEEVKKPVRRAAAAKKVESTDVPVVSTGRTTRSRK